MMAHIMRMRYTLALAILFLLFENESPCNMLLITGCSLYHYAVLSNHKHDHYKGTGNGENDCHVKFCNI